MRDLQIKLDNQPGNLATVGEALARAGVNIEGGGVFAQGTTAVAHFLVANGAAARDALAAVGIAATDREVLVQRLRQEMPGQLGKIARAMAEAGVNIEVMYSDHDGQLILVVDDLERGRLVSSAWSRSSDTPQARELAYAVTLRWGGSRGEGTSSYASYGRDFELAAEGKPTLSGSADPHFRGDAARWNPEELLVGALSACHQLWYLHLCAEAGVIVTSYEDRAVGALRLDGRGNGRIAQVALRPKVELAAGADLERARALHTEAHARCFLARSVQFPIALEVHCLHSDSRN